MNICESVLLILEYEINEGGYCNYYEMYIYCKVLQGILLFFFFVGLFSFVVRFRYVNLERQQNKWIIEMQFSYFWVLEF